VCLAKFVCTCVHERGRVCLVGGAGIDDLVVAVDARLDVLAQDELRGYIYIYIYI
jgi:hypothetical protein